MFPKHRGTIPSNELFERRRISSDVKLQMEDGSTPFNLLEESDKAPRIERFPMVDGIGPSNNFLKDEHG